MNGLELLNMVNDELKAPSIISNYNVLKELIGNLEVSEINDEVAYNIMKKIDILDFETGYAIAKPKLLKQASILTDKKINKRKFFNTKSSTLFDILEGRKVSIDYAKEFAAINNLVLDENFYLYSKRRTYSIDTKRKFKNCLKRVFDYAVSIGAIDKNPIPNKYVFINNKVFKETILTTLEIQQFVDNIFNYGCENTSINVILFLLLKLDYQALRDLKIKDIDFITNVINLKDETIDMSDYLSKKIKFFISNEDSSANVVKDYPDRYYRTAIYKIRGENKKINMASLKQNYSLLIKMLNEYVDDKKINIFNYEETGLETLEDYNDFTEFLRLKKIYGGI